MAVPLSAAMALTAASLVRHLAPQTSGSGIQYVEAILTAIVAHILTGSAPTLETATTDIPLHALSTIGLGGVVLGLIGMLFNKSIVMAFNFIGKIPARLWCPPAAIIGGMSVFF